MSKYYLHVIHSKGSFQINLSSMACGSKHNEHRRQSLSGQTMILFLSWTPAGSINFWEELTPCLRTYWFFNLYHSSGRNYSEACQKLGMALHSLLAKEMGLLWLAWINYNSFLSPHTTQQKETSLSAKQVKDCNQPKGCIYPSKTPVIPFSAI